MKKTLINWKRKCIQHYLLVYQDKPPLNISIKRQVRRQMGNKGNVVLYLDKELVEKSKELGFNLSKTFENHLKYLVNGYSPVSMQNNANYSKYKSYLVGPEEFESSSIAPEATSLDQASRRPRCFVGQFFVGSYDNIGVGFKL